LKWSDEKHRVRHTAIQSIWVMAYLGLAYLTGRMCIVHSERELCTASIGGFGHRTSSGGDAVHHDISSSFPEHPSRDRVLRHQDSRKTVASMFLFSRGLYRRSIYESPVNSNRHSSTRTTDLYIFDISRRSLLRSWIVARLLPYVALIDTLSPIFGMHELGGLKYSKSNHE
jgi:hypothetical protein